MRALVIGGTGPTGPLLSTGCLSAGMTSAWNRGVHDTPDQHVERIVGDPHFVETLSDACRVAGLICVSRPMVAFVM